MAVFLYSVCHVVLVVMDTLDSPDVLFRFLWTAEQMKSNCLRSSVDTSDMGSVNNQQKGVMMKWRAAHVYNEGCSLARVVTLYQMLYLSSLLCINIQWNFSIWTLHTKEASVLRTPFLFPSHTFVYNFTSSVRRAPYSRHFMWSQCDHHREVLT